MDLRTRVWSAGKLLLLLGALVATYGIFAATSMRLALRAREVTVPDLTNHTINDATAIAGNLGLALRVDETRRIDTRVPAGSVVTQDPPAGVTTRQQRSIRVWVSEGPRGTVVPVLNGQTERDAQKRLAQDSLEVTTVSEIQSEGYAPDVVVAQDPPPNAAGSGVALLVNRAEQPANYVMPDLIGVNGESAAALLRARGFRAAVVGAVPYPGVAAGFVVRQNPAAGFQIAQGESISLEVSR